jgi:short-subunit dehydrogenase
MNDMQFFQKKVVIVTGASGGIGRVTASVFARLNAKVVLASRNEEKLNSLKNDIEFTGGEALVVRTDVSSFDDTQRMASEAISKWGKIDILVANAGQYFQDIGHEIDINSYKESLAVNFMGTLNVIKSVLPYMKSTGKGHIVIVNSLDSKKGIIGDGPYVAAKSALDGFGDVLRQELKADGIHVTSLFPGRVDTPMIKCIKVPWISPKIQPEKVVRTLIKGLKRNKAIIIVPSVYFLLGSLNSSSPRLVDWFYRIFKIEGQRIEDLV